MPTPSELAALDTLREAGYLVMPPPSPDLPQCTSTMNAAIAGTPVHFRCGQPHEHEGRHVFALYWPVDNPGLAAGVHGDT